MIHNTHKKICLKAQIVGKTILVKYSPINDSLSRIFLATSLLKGPTKKVSLFLFVVVKAFSTDFSFIFYQTIMLIYGVKEKQWEMYI